MTPKSRQISGNSRLVESIYLRIFEKRSAVFFPRRCVCVCVFGLTWFGLTWLGSNWMSKNDSTHECVHQKAHTRTVQNERINETERERELTMDGEWERELVQTFIVLLMLVVVVVPAVSMLLSLSTYRMWVVQFEGSSKKKKTSVQKSQTNLNQK